MRSDNTRTPYSEGWKQRRVDGEALPTTMRSLNYVEEVALVEAVERWWLTQDDPVVSVAEGT